MNKLMISLFVFYTATTFATDRHTELAMEFDRVSSSQEKTELVERSVLPVVLQQFPDLNAHKEALAGQLLALIESHEFKLAKAEVYKAMFNEQELALLIEWFRHPAYQLFNDHRFDINERLMEFSLSQYFNLAEGFEPKKPQK